MSEAKMVCRVAVTSQTDGLVNWCGEPLPAGVDLYLHPDPQVAILQAEIARLTDLGSNLACAYDAALWGWKEAAIAWEVCASIHRGYAKGKDPLFTTRQAAFVKHADDARAMVNP